MNGIPFFDILLFAGVAIFLVLRLGSVLGKRTGHENPPKSYKDVMESNDDREEDVEDKVVVLPSLKERHDKEFDDKALGGPLHDGFLAIRSADANFSPSQFLEGARSAFEWILVAFVEGNRSSLKNLLSQEVYKNFETAISKRESLGQRLEEKLVGVDRADIVEAELKGSIALVTVNLISKQVNVVYNNLNEIVEGDPNKVVDVTDIWTFARDTATGDPNWQLVATRHPE